MKALVYGGPSHRAWDDRPRPQLVDMTDVIVQMTTSTLCGTDLHILRGDVPTVSEGRDPRTRRRRRRDRGRVGRLRVPSW